MKNHTARRSQRIQQQNSPYPASPFKASASYSLDDLSDYNRSSRENSKMSTDFIVEFLVAPLSESLQNFAKTQISAELKKLQSSLLEIPVQDAEKIDQITDELIKQLIELTRSDALDLTNTKENNELFSRHSKNFVKALHLLNKEQLSSLLSDDDCTVVRTLLDDYEVYVSRNVNIFQNITRHHEDISHKDWNEVVEDEHALQEYAQAANEMGEKLWVTESNYYACNFCKNYFLPEESLETTAADLAGTNTTTTTTTISSSEHKKPKYLSIKFYMKELSARQLLEHQQKADEEERQRFAQDRALWDSLYEQLSRISLVDYPEHKIRLLDVGSCYNPLRKFPDLFPLFDVTAIDLCPADPSVFKCDFLTVDIPATMEDYQKQQQQKQKQPIPRSEDTRDVSKPSGSSPELLILPPSYYHAIVMSLVLSYLPTPQAREVMIDKARALLLSPGQENKPHNCGLLIIIEKQSIFTPPKLVAAANQKKKKMKQSSQSQQKEESTSTASGIAATASSSVTLEDAPEYESIITIDDWKATIASKGFFLINYQLFVSSDKRKSHIFIFKTSQLHQSQSQQQQRSSLDQSEEEEQDEIKASSAQVKPLWIKQDFVRRSSEPVVEETKTPLNRSSVSTKEKQY